MQSIFTNKLIEPSTDDLETALKDTFPHWSNLIEYVLERYPKATADWKFSGNKFGWSYRLSDRKRVILYLLPRGQFFKVALVFGKAAVKEVLDCNVSADIKDELIAANSYAEGTGIRISVTDDELLSDIKYLIDVKLRN